MFSRTKPDASTANYKFVPTKASSFQGFSFCLSSRHILGRSLGVFFRRASGVGPVHRLGDGVVEVVHETFEFLDQVDFRCKASTPHHATVDDSENDFNLVEPRTMFWDVDETNAMTYVR